MTDSPVRIVGALTRAWVRLYTRGVSAEARTRRRTEVDCDLWEQAHDASEIGRRTSDTALEILARLVLGMPADLSWRLEHRSSRRSAARMIEGSRFMFETVKKNKMFVVAILLGALYIAVGFGSAVGGENVGIGWSLLMLAFGGLVVGGLVVWTRGRRLGGLLLASGAVAGAVMTFWVFFIPPVVAILIVIWVITNWRGSAPAPA